MVGIIVTGHGRFADGLTSSIELIAGKQKDYVAVNFEEETDQLERDLLQAFDALKECDGIIVFSDLAGGSPFKTAVVLTQDMPNVEVIAGVNLPMLAEVTVARTFGMELADLINMALNTGKEQIIWFEKTPLEEIVESDDEDYSDGI